MRYELKTVESLIEKHLQPNNIAYGQGSLMDLQELKEEFQAETERIRGVFIESVFNFKKDKQVERYIQQHQTSLIRLCNKVIKKISPETFRKSYQSNGNIDEFSTINYILYSALENILTFIENYFSKYFNQHEKIPTSYQIIGQIEFREKLNGVKNDKGCKLIEIALYPINEFVSQNTPITFRKLIYLKTLYDEVKATCTRCNGIDKECTLNCSLIYLNFNSFKYFTYITTQIKAEVESQKSPQKKVEILSYHLKRLNQSQVKPNIAYKHKHSSLKNQLTSWIAEEICDIERIYQPIIEFPDTSKNLKGRPLKIKINLSVPVIARFFKTFADAGYVENSNPKELITFLANHISSKYKENITPGSFSSKFYAKDDVSTETLKEILINLLNQLNKKG